MDRLSRWSWEISALPYKFVILPGTANVVADLLSRWGASQNEHKTSAQACSIEEQDSGIEGDNEPTKESTLPIRFCSKKSQMIQARKHEPSTIYEIPHPFEWPCFGDIADAQSKLTKNELQGASLEQNGIWVHKGRIVLPIADMELISRVCIIAHAGSAGHRGIAPTLRAIKRRFVFKDMSTIVKRFVGRCLQCLKSSSGKKIPLAFGHQILPKGPGDVIHLDHLYMQKESESGDKYLLVIKDGFSSLCELVAVPSTDAAPTATALLKWIARYGLMSTIVTDGPSHFKNSLLETLTKTLRIKHHIVISYSPWENGGIERHNRECFKIFRTILGESGPAWNFRRWPEIVPLVQYSLHTTECTTLCNLTPLEVFTGRKPKSTVDLMAFSGHEFGSIDTAIVSSKAISKHINELRDTLSKINHQAKVKKRSKRLSKQCGSKAN
jgi:hypothetical protein